MLRNGGEVETDACVERTRLRGRVFDVEGCEGTFGMEEVEGWGGSGMVVLEGVFDIKTGRCKLTTSVFKIRSGRVPPVL